MLYPTPFSESATKASSSIYKTTGLLIVIGFLLSACKVPTQLPQDAKDSEGVATSTNVIQAPAVLFTVPTPTIRPSLELTAKISAASFRDLSFEIEGTLVEVNLQLGRIVTPDLPAARLDPAPLRLAIENIFQERTRALSGYMQAEAEKRRQTLLFEAGSATEAALVSAAELLQARKFNLDQVEQQLAEAHKAEAASVLTGGYNGTVREVHAKVGDFIRARAPVYTIETDHPYQAKLLLPDGSGWVLREPVELTISVDNNANEAISVTQIELGVERNVVTLTLKNVPPDLRIGDDLRVDIHSKAPPSNILLPYSVLLQDADGIYVMVWQNNQTKRKSVHPVMLKDDGVITKSALSGGEKLIVPQIK
jgi:RND family efflux transporter MFP subunit